MCKIGAVVMTRPARTCEIGATRVYVMVSADGLTKIGISKAPTQRRRGLQSANAHRLRLYFQIKPRDRSAFQVEQEAMRLLARWRKSGEWFTCRPQMARAAVEAAAGDERMRRFIELTAEHEIVGRHSDLIAELCLPTFQTSSISWHIQDELWAAFSDLAREFVGKRIRRLTFKREMELFINLWKSDISKASMKSMG